MSRRAVFLDRDGVLNRAPTPRSLAELEVLPGVPEALRLLGELGFLRIVVTNQPDVARGRQTREAVEEIHRALRERLPLDDVLTCFHDDVDRCDCRKPKPGLLTRAAAAHDIDLGGSFLVGDRGVDILAGRAAGCTTFLVPSPSSGGPDGGPDHRVRDLREAAQRILGLQGPGIERLRVQIFADGADLDGIVQMSRRPYVKGFTTNPTLMRKAGITDYRRFALDVLAAVPRRPISFEVFADDFGEMERQAREIASWGECVFVKLPVTDTHGRSAAPLIQRLARDGVRLNVTALLTLEQVETVSAALGDHAQSYISLFAGRLADTGRDPVPVMAQALEVMREAPQQRLIWASPRELLNILQADAIGCHVITVTNDLLHKLDLLGKDPQQFSLETVRMFHDDAKNAGYTL